MRIVSQRENLLVRFDELKEMLLSRNYPKRIVNAAIEKARQIPRLEALKKVIRKKNDRVIFTVTYHPALPSKAGIIVKHWRSMIRNPEALKAFPKPPMVAYRQPANLRKTLCHTKLPPKGKPKRQILGTQKCKDEGCPMCPYVSKEKEFKSYVTNKSYKSTNSFTCHTSGAIYLITCLKCHKQYVGQSGRQVKTRCKEHVTYIRNNKEATGTHFNERGHTHWDFQIHIIEKVIPNTTHMRLQRENFWIHTLQSKTPEGLNRHVSAY